MADPDFGTDIDCLVEGPDGELGLSPTFDLAEPRSTLIQAIVHRFETPRGQIPDDPDYGLDVRAWLNDDLSPTKLFALQRGLIGEAEKDQRVLSAKARAAFDARTRKLSLTLAIDTAEGPFRLTLAVDALNVEILSVT